MAMTQTMLRNFLDLDLCIVNSQSHDQALCVPISIRRAALNPEANKQRVWAIGLSATTSLESHLDTPADKPKPTLIMLFETNELAFMCLLLWYCWILPYSINKLQEINIKQPSSLTWFYLLNDLGRFNWLSYVFKTSLGVWSGVGPS